MKRQSFILFLILIMSLVVGSVLADQSSSIKVQMYNANLAAKNNTIYPWYQITNTSTASVKLSDVKIRYFYTIDGEKPQSFKCDWSSIGSANVTGSFVKLDAPFTGADYTFELGFTTGAGYLKPGQSIQVQSRFYKNDWSNYTQTNDYSFNSTANQYVDWNKITVLVGSGPVENFVTSSDYTQDNQWVQGPVSIHLSVAGTGSANVTTYYTINGGSTATGNLIQLSNDGIYNVSFWSKGQTSYTETPHQITVKIDRTGPVVTGTINPIPNANSWINSDATVTFAATDAGSGVDSVTSPVTISTDGIGQKVSGTAKDKVGNSSTTSVTVNLDKTAPVTTSDYTTNSQWVNHAVQIHLSATDTCSGVAK